MPAARHHATARLRARSGPTPGPVARFLLRLVAGWAAGWALIALVPAIDRIVIDATTQSFAALLSLARPDITRSGTFVSAAGVSIQIVSACTSLVPTLLLAGAIVAYPAGARARAAGLTAGLLALWLFNQVRLVALLVILARFPAWFDFAHVYLWQTVGVLAAAALFAIWVKRLGRDA